MTKKGKVRLAIFVMIQLAIIASSLLFHQKLTLLYYINISFYFSFVFLMAALFVLIAKSGFFDIVTKSFRLAFSRLDEKKKFRELAPLSESMGFNQAPLVFHGSLTALLMLIALIFYYA